MSFFYVSSVVAFFLTIFLAFFVYIEGRKEAVNRMCSLFIIWLSFGILVDFVQSTHIAKILSLHKIFQITYIIYPFIVPIFLHFIFLFTKTKVKTGWLNFLYGISGLLLAVNLFFSGSFFKSIELRPEKILILQASSYLYMLYIFTGIVFSTIITVNRFIKSKGLLKEKMGYYLLATVIILISGLTYAGVIRFSMALPRVDNFFIAIYLSLLVYIITSKSLVPVKTVVNRLAV
ncbi:MAG: hypothetical protein GY730_11395 [bacterium]|nr:hypothetical protein [bacterium]